MAGGVDVVGPARSLVELGRRVKAVRLYRRLRQDDLERMTGIPGSGLSLVENAKGPLHPAWRARLAEALDVPARYLELE